MGSLPVNWDVELFLAINGLADRSVLADWTMLALARPSSALIPAALGAAYWLWAKKREALIGACILAGAVLFADFIGAQVKHLVARARPCWVLQDVHQLAGCGGTFSFPSNHALNTAAVAAFAHVLYPWTGWVSWPIVAVIGFARVYVGAHYVTDVLGGWLIGAIMGGGVAFALARRTWFRSHRAGAEDRARIV